MLIIGICGASGSGKSTLARRVAETLPCKTLVLGQDCYYKSFSAMNMEEHLTVNFDEPSIFDHDALLEDVIQLNNGHPITTKTYDYTRSVRVDKPDLIQPPDVLLLEGIHMFYDKRLLEMMTLKVYLQVDADICLLRRIKRDIKQRGRSIDNIAKQYLDTVKPMFEKYISKYIEDADFTVMRGGKNQAAIDAISSYMVLRLKTEGNNGMEK